MSEAPGKRAAGAAADVAEQVRTALAWLQARGSQRNIDGMARYGIVGKNPYGVSVANLRLLSQQFAPSHELALALWETDRYEARMLAAFVDDPGRVTPAQMNRWCREFDNWAVCDHTCFHLFDRTPHAYDKVREWAGRREEFVKRAAFALLASLAGHDKKAPDEPFVHGLGLIEEAATDDRNFVKKGVSWALRRIGTRNARLHAEATKVAGRLAASSDAAARWIGRDALRDLTRKKPKPEKAPSQRARRTR